MYSAIAPLFCVALVRETVEPLSEARRALEQFSTRAMMLTEPAWEALWPSRCRHSAHVRDR